MARSVPRAGYVSSRSARDATQCVDVAGQFTLAADRHRRLETRVDEIADQLPHLIESVRRLGYSILNVEVHTPSLHDVFLDLTGKELRD